MRRRLDVLPLLADNLDLGDRAGDSQLVELGRDGVVGGRCRFRAGAVAADFAACRFDQAGQRQATFARRRWPRRHLIDDDAHYDEAEDEQ